jgi:hypothetical protein
MYGILARQDCAKNTASLWNVRTTEGTEMPYVNKPRPYKKEYDQQQARGELPNRMERQRARRKVDKTGRDADKDGVADKREGKDIAHVKALSKGGTNKDGIRIQSPSKNRSFKRDSKSNLVSEISTREKKKKKA